MRDDEPERHLVGLETSLLDADVFKSDRVVGSLADDFVEFRSSGARGRRMVFHQEACIPA